MRAGIVVLFGELELKGLVVQSVDYSWRHCVVCQKVPSLVDSSGVTLRVGELLVPRWVVFVAAKYRSYCYVPSAHAARVYGVSMDLNGSLLVESPLNAG